MSFIMKPDQTWLAVDQIYDLVRQVCHCVRTPTSLKVSKAITMRDWSTLGQMSVDPRNYRNSTQFARDYQVVSWLKKAEFLPGLADKQRKKALDRFWQAEKACEDTNSRLASQSSESPLHWYFFQKEYGQDVYTALNKAREIVWTIVGNKPKGAKQRFGPGATSLVRRGITLPDKYARRVEMTPELYPYWRDVCGVRWCKSITDVNYVSGTRIAFVPKSIDTERTIGIEPHLNIYAQLGAGAELRERFRPWIDLNVGQDRNRALAAIAHSVGLATIDFSSASDTVARAIVEFLFPPRWVEYLDRIRSHRFTLDGEEHEFHKHSSMGNGYTFELESIIFYALARAVSEGTVSVYGDDVILPQADAAFYMKVCEAAGFTVNREKSFLNGSFYESCGADYFEGINVRPWLLRRLNPLTGFKMHNDLRYLAKTLDIDRLDEFAKYLRHDAPNRDLRDCFIPFKGDYGNVGFEVYFDEVPIELKTARNGYCGFRTKALKFQPDHKLFKGDERGLLAALDTGSEQSSAPIRGRGVWQVGHLTTFGSWVRSV